MSSTSADPEAAARQPLLQRRDSTRLQERLQFQQSQRQAVVNVASSGRGILARCLLFLIQMVALAAICVWSYVYIGTLWVIVCHSDAPCDQPLGSWLLIWMILPTVQILLDPFPVLQDTLHPAYDMEIHQRDQGRWYVRKATVLGACLGIGYFWFKSSKTCYETNNILYGWVGFVLQFYMLMLTFFLVLPLVLGFCWLLVFHCYSMMIDRGWISNPQAARADLIEDVEVVAYEPALFATDDNSGDTRPSGECCCCSELFSPELPIVKTQCGHYYHKQCLGEWLKLAKSCPLCRFDLDEGKAKGPDEEASAEAALTEGDAPTTLTGGTAGDAELDDAELARQLQEEEFQAAGSFGGVGQTI